MRPVFLVLEKSELVAEDLVDLIRGQAPAADIRISNSSEELNRIIEAIDSVAVAILNGNIQAPEIQTLADKIQKRGGRVVLHGDEDAPEHLTNGGKIVQIRGPFTSQMIQDAIFSRDQ